MEENPQTKPAKARSEHVSRSQDSAALACPDCSAKVTLDDAFCRKCGAKLEFQLACPSCGAELDKGDVFCSKCGTKLS